MEKKNIKKIINFFIGTKEYGLEIHHIKEVVNFAEITSMPDAPDFIEGIINLRNRIIPVLNIRQRFKFESDYKITSDTKIIVVDINVLENKKALLGFVADKVEHVIDMPLDTIKNVPALVYDIDKKYVEAICKYEGRLIVLLDVDKILDVHEKYATFQKK